MATQVYTKKLRKVKEPILFQCTWCIKPQLMTTNGKCKRCGSSMVRQKHWDKVAIVMELILKHKDKGFPLPINEKIYFVPIEYFDEFQKFSNLGWKYNAILVERIRKECEGYFIR